MQLTLSPELSVRGGRAAIDFYIAAFLLPGAKAN
jgi:hypothetical protein